VKKIYTVKAKAIVHTVRTYKKFASSTDEAREMVALEPNSFINEDKICSNINPECSLPVWIDETEELK
jgi:hypothetical protein